MGEDSVYGNEWSYLTTYREGLIRYWRDGLLRSGKYENIITIGMRGERDSLMLGGGCILRAEYFPVKRDHHRTEKTHPGMCRGESTGNARTL